MVTIQPTTALNRELQQKPNSKPGTQSQQKHSGMKTVTVRDRQRRRESRISGAMRGQSTSVLISGGFGIFLSMQGKG